MSQQSDDDLFHESSMTFGEHLEELRRALVKALLWLVAGFVIGLVCGSYVVDFIKLPLVDALKGHYTLDSAYEYQLLLDRLNHNEGEELPTRAKDSTEIADLAADLLAQGLVMEEVRVDRQILRNAVADPKSDTADNASTTANLSVDPSKLVSLPIWRPISKDERIDPSALGVSEAFMFYLKASLLAGFVFASPMIFREAWMFVAAGLYPHERRYVHVFLPFSIALFLSGSLFCFFIVFKFVLGFLFSFNDMLGIAIQPRISEWLSFALILPLAFGISFQLPLVMLFLQRIRVFTIEIYLSKWRVAILVIAIISMLLTPTDPTSMIAMLVPLTVLYFAGIGLCKYMPAGKGLLDE